MARTSTRKSKGCPMCKYYKHMDHGQAIRKPFSELRKIGKTRRVSRHDLGREA